jgi:AraC family transcriptional regulator of adaptative response/methylated-DNA-[protein]-cysteine methyltransferase
MSSLHVRVATLEDIPSLCELLNQLFSQEVEFTPQKHLQEKGLKAIMENPTVGIILVAIIEQKIVGMLNLLFTIFTALGGWVILLEDMIVDEAHRDKKIGSALLSEAKKYAKEHGFLRITLLSDFDNDKAHAFYERHGFVDSPRKVFTCKDF